MGNIIQLRNIVKTLLNDNCVDPYPSDITRRGLHFFDESDDINFSRGNTFPKGYIQHVNATSGISKSGLGKTGFAKKYGTLDIYYYVKEKQSYTTGSDTYKNQDLVSYMIGEIQNTLLNNSLAGSDYYLTEAAFGIADAPRLQELSGNKFWVGIIPVSYYWGERYGC